jgi:Zn-dependent protease with chaperone function
LILISVSIALIGLGRQEQLGQPAGEAGNAGLATVLTLLSTAGAALVCVGVNLLIARRIDRSGQLNRSRYRRALTLLGWAILGLFGAQVFLLHWPAGPIALLEYLHATEVPLLGEVLTWLPFLAMLLAYWASAYPVDARLRALDLQRRLEAALPVYSGGAAGRGVWTLRQFLGFQVRFNLLFILLPLMGVLLAEVIINWAFGPNGLGPWLQSVPISHPDQLRLMVCVLLASFVGVLVLSPPVLVRLFSNSPLPAGPLLDKLHAVMHRLGGTIRAGGAGSRVRKIVLWNTHGMVSNAAVMGPWRRLRYVMLSDALVETLADEQIEGVFGHEFGHVIRHHIFYYMMLMISMSSLGESVVRRLASWLLRGDLVQRWSIHPDVIVGVMVAAIGAAMLLIFGFVSRRFEWQADLVGAQGIVVGDLADSPFLPKGAEPQADRYPSADLSREAEDPDPLSRPPTLAAAAIYSSGLFRIADLNGLDRRQRSWRHGSIDERAIRLRRLCDPAEFVRFRRTVALIKLAILLLAAATAVLFATGA